MRRTTSRRSAPTATADTDEDYAADNEDEETEERSARRRHPSASARRRSRDEDEETEERPRSRRRGDSDERPARKARAEAPKAGGGWGGYSEEKSKGGGGFDRLKITDDPSIIWFCEPEPFAVYRQHWVEGEGRQSFTCIGEGCPLCKADSKKPSLRALFNVIDLSEGEPKLQIMECGVQLADLVHDFSEQAKTSPLNKKDLYWEVSRTETKGNGRKRYQYKILPVKARDLPDDYDIEPLTPEEIADLTAELHVAEDVVRVDDIEDLEDLARTL